MILPEDMDTLDARSKLEKVRKFAEGLGLRAYVYTGINEIPYLHIYYYDAQPHKGNTNSLVTFNIVWVVARDSVTKTYYVNLPDVLAAIDEIYRT